MDYVDWEGVFQKELYRVDEIKRRNINFKKFVILPGAIPWYANYEKNLHVTLEWIYRQNRKATLELSKEPILNLIKDYWYEASFDPGFFVHLCYPKSLLDFRGKYEGVLAQIKALGSNNIVLHLDLADTARVYLWSAWECTGYDGRTNYTVGDLTSQYGVKRWSNKCSRCGSELPKSIQMWVKLQYDLKGLKNDQEQF